MGVNEKTKQKKVCLSTLPFLSAPKLRKPPLICNTLQLHLKLLAGKKRYLVLSTNVWKMAWISVCFDLFAEGTFSVAFLYLARWDDGSSTCQSQPIPHSTLGLPHQTTRCNVQQSCVHLSPPLCCEGRDPSSPYARSLVYHRC